MGKSRKRKSIPAGFSLDPGVVTTIAALAKDYGVSKSALVNYILDRVIRATEDVEVIEEIQEAKRIAAKNKSIVFPSSNAIYYDLCIRLEFTNELI